MTLSASASSSWVVPHGCMSITASHNNSHDIVRSTMYRGHEPCS